MRLYVPIFVLALLALGFATFSVTFGAFAGPKRWNRAKLESYECGIEPTPMPPDGGRVPAAGTPRTGPLPRPRGGAAPVRSAWRGRRARRWSRPEAPATAR